MPLDGWLWRLLVLGQNVFILSVLGAVGYALFRRVIARYPRRVTLSRDGVVILLLIGGVVVTEWFAEAFRLAAFGDPDAGWAIAAYPLSLLLGGLLPAAWLPVGYAVFFWANVALVSFFLVYLPRSKHLHIVTAFFNAALRKLKPRGELPTMDLETEDTSARFGIKTIEDMSWKDLLDGFTCTECGRCQEACPAWATGKPLNPKTMIMGIREMAVEAEHGVSLIPWIRPTDAPGGQATPVVDTAIPYDAVWDCVTCGACVEACPVMIEHVDKIVGLRRNLVLEESRFPAELTASFTNMERYQNIWGQPQSSRLDWARGLPFSVPTAAEVVESGGPDAVAELECLYWVGCAASFDDRNRRVARAVVTCLEAAGVQVRRARPGGVVHRRPGAADGQRVRLPDARRGQRRDPEPIQAEDNDHRVPALLQHDRRRVPPARRHVQRRASLAVPEPPHRGGPVACRHDAARRP